MKKGEVRELINQTLNLSDHKDVSEAYVAQPKQYDHATELISEKAKKAHNEIYQARIATLNNVSSHLDGTDRRGAVANGSAYRSLKLDETAGVNSVWLHELFFANMSDVHSEITTDSLSYMRLERDWGAFDDWQFDMVACAMSSRNGWAVCGYHMFLQRYVNIFIDADDTHVPVGLYPVIVIDVHEHAYTSDYLNDRETYVVGQMRELSWVLIEERFKRTEKIVKALTG